MSMAKLVRTAFILYILAFVFASYLNADKLIYSVVTNITENYVIIKWKTDQLSTGSVAYGEDSARLHNQAFSIGEAINHQILLNNLQKGTVYYYEISCNFQYKANKPVVVKSGIKTFLTAGNPLPVITKNEVSSQSKEYVRIKWEANAAVLSSLIYVKEGEINRNVIPMEETASGEFLISGLKPSSRYYYFIQIVNKDNITNNTEIKSFSTLEDNLALGKTVSGTFTNYVYEDGLFDMSPNSLQRITDGRVDYFKGMSVSGDIRSNNQQIIIDLGKKTKISKVIVIWRALAYSTEYNVEISEDLKVWKTIASQLDADKVPRTYMSGTPVKVQEIQFPTKEGRYVRLTAIKSKYFSKHGKWNFIQIHEIKIFP